MKILIDARFFGLEHAGLGRYTMQLIHELGVLDKTNDYVILLRKKYFESVKLPKNFKKVKVEAKHYWFKEQALVPIVIRKHKPDVVHFLHSNIPVFYTGKFIVTIHDLTMYRQGTDATTLPLPLYYAKRIPFKMVFRKAVYESKHIIVPSQAVKEELVTDFKIPSEKVEVTYEGLLKSDKQKSESQTVLKKYELNNKKYFLYVGNLYPHKNIRRAIEAVVSLKNNDVSFVIVSGRGVFRRRLEKIIKKLHAEDKVKILDFVPDADLSHLYNHSIAFVFPSVSEGFGLPGLEALQAGTILVASNTPVFKEIYQKSAMYFDPHDVESIKKALHKVLILKDADRRKLITESKHVLKQYSWEKMAKETLALYKKASNNQ